MGQILGKAADRLVSVAKLPSARERLNASKSEPILTAKSFIVSDVIW